MKLKRKRSLVKQQLKQFKKSKWAAVYLRHLRWLKIKYPDAKKELIKKLTNRIK